MVIMGKVLNLYCGIGGNRKLWKDVDVTAVDIDPKIAEIYQDFFPEDMVIVGDAHQYLLEHYDDGWDFIWSSPPCPSHSDMRRCRVHSGHVRAIYPDMSLYQEIILLGNFVKHPYVVENVRPYYEPLIEPQIVSRHSFWSNFHIPPFFDGRKFNLTKVSWKIISEFYGIDISDYDVDQYGKRQMLRNCVNPKLGLHIFNSRNNQTTLEEWR